MAVCITMSGYVFEIQFPKRLQNLDPNSKLLHIKGICAVQYAYVSDLARVSVQGVESLWGDCRFIPADWGSQ